MERPTDATAKKKKPDPGTTPTLGLAGTVKPPDDDAGGKSAGPGDTAPPRPNVDPVNGKASAAGLADSSQATKPGSGVVVLGLGALGLGLLWWLS
jgi:hypothetical protein